MRLHALRSALSVLLLISFVAAVSIMQPVRASAQEEEVYSATVIASEGLAGSSGRMRIRIVSYTTPQEKAQLVDAFQKNLNAGVAVLRTMSKGYINIEGQSGRKIEAVFSRDGQKGRDIIIIGDHLASKLEKWEGVNAGEYPSAVIHLRISPDGDIAGEVFPAVRLALTPDGFIDAKTDSSNKITMINIARR